MRVIDFKMERNGLVSEGDEVELREGILPNSYYYVVEPAVAMSANFKPRDRVMARKGIIKEIVENDRGFYLKVEVEE